VAYYLHGATGDETDWTRRAQLDAVMDSLVAAGMPEMIVAMPDGDSYSFYTTYNVLLDAAGCRRMMLTENGNAERDCVAWPHYDDYVAYDIVRHVDAKYRTLATRDRRAIAGLSMGGYGAITLALRYPATFAAAASHSGVLSPLEFAPPPFGRKPFPRADSAGFARSKVRFAPIFRVVFGADSAGWYARDPATLASRLVAAGKPLPALFVDCGTEDTYLPESRAFREALAARGIAVTYHEWPGAHTWEYWRAHAAGSLSWIASRIAPPIRALTP
jgi:S-formylglutathione hydrolase FrmB